MYAAGQGMPVDDAEAYSWASLARALGTGEDETKGNGLRDELAKLGARSMRGREDLNFQT